MLEGTKKFFPTEYDKFKNAMKEAAEKEELPALLQMDDLSNLSLNDLQDLFYEFNYDTGLSIEGHVFTCDECGMLHLMIEINYPEEKEEKRLLQ